MKTTKSLVMWIIEMKKKRKRREIEFVLKLDL